MNLLYIYYIFKVYSLSQIPNPYSNVSNFINYILFNVKFKYIKLELNCKFITKNKPKKMTMKKIMFGSF